MKYTSEEKDLLWKVYLELSMHFEDFNQKQKVALYYLTCNTLHDLFGFLYFASKYINPEEIFKILRGEKK